jgi:hypothetical protein
VIYETKWIWSHLLLFGQEHRLPRLVPSRAGGPDNLDLVHDATMQFCLTDYPFSQLCKVGDAHPETD